MLFLPAHEFLVRRFRQTRDAFGFGFVLTRARAGFVAVLLLHLFLSFVKIEFVQARAGADFVSLDVPGLTFHDCSLRWLRLKCPTDSSPSPFGEGRGEGLSVPHASRPPLTPPKWREQTRHLGFKDHTFLLLNFVRASSQEFPLSSAGPVCSSQYRQRSVCSRSTRASGLCRRRQTRAP